MFTFVCEAALFLCESQIRFQDANGAVLFRTLHVEALPMIRMRLFGLWAVLTLRVDPAWNRQLRRSSLTIKLLFTLCREPAP